jgi:transcriptional regulator with XRE-family HTH domain
MLVMTDKMTIGKKIRKARRELSMTLRDLSKLTGIAPNTLSNYENDKFKPATENCFSIATALRVSVEYLMDRDATDGVKITTTNNPTTTISVNNGDEVEKLSRKTDEQSSEIKKLNMKIDELNADIKKLTEELLKLNEEIKQEKDKRLELMERLYNIK